MKILLKQKLSLSTPPTFNTRAPTHSLRLPLEKTENTKFRLCLLWLPLVVCGGWSEAKGKQKLLSSIKYLLGKVWSARIEASTSRR